MTLINNNKIKEILAEKFGKSCYGFFVACFFIIFLITSKLLVKRKIYFVRGKAKVLIGVCKGKKNYDKRESIKERDLNREMQKNYKYN